MQLLMKNQYNAAKGNRNSTLVPELLKMDFRLIVLSLSLWLIPAYGDTMTELDELAQTVYQYPNKTLTQISALEQRLDQEATSEENRLRL